MSGRGRVGAGRELVPGMGLVRVLMTGLRHLAGLGTLGWEDRACV